MKQKKATIILKALDIQGDGWHLLVKARINNRVALLVVDTGASRTVLDKNRIEKYMSKKNIVKHEMLSTGLGTDSMQSHVAVIKKLEIGKWKLQNEEVVLLDLSHVNNSYSKMGFKKIDGVLGSDVLLKTMAIIDFGKKTLTFNY